MEVSGQLPALTSLLLVKNPGPHLMGGRKGSGVVLDIFEKRNIFAVAGVRITDPTARILITIPAALSWTLSIMLNIPL
jgi:hypothetical protein